MEVLVVVMVVIRLSFSQRVTLPGEQKSRKTKVGREEDDKPVSCVCVSVYVCTCMHVRVGVHVSSPANPHRNYDCEGVGRETTGND